MIRATTSCFNVTVSGLAIYLDNWAVINLAKGDRSRRKRFIDALCTGGADLMFSVANAAELIGPQGDSRDAVRAFLDEVGPHWFPVELNPTEVVQRELRGADPSKCCVSREFFMDYWTVRTKDYTPGSGKVIDPSEVFRLGAILDWVGPQSESIRKRSADLDDALIKKINGYRVEFERNPPWLDQKFPILAFSSSKPAMFTYISLVRTMIVEAKSYQLKKNDGLDFCHAVMASAFASVATLDKAWKRRIERLPANSLAHVYDPSQLDQMVTDIELALRQRRLACLASGLKTV
jgi:hypothetical protein